MINYNKYSNEELVEMLQSIPKIAGPWNICFDICYRQQVVPKDNQNREIRYIYAATIRRRGSLGPCSNPNEWNSYLFNQTFKNKECLMFRVDRELIKQGWRIIDI